MTERIDNLKYSPELPSVPETNDPFFNGPGEFLCMRVVELLRCAPEFKLIFGEYIDAYRRMDYSIRMLPALRIYSESGRKEFDSWFITGDLKADIIWPANIRRIEHTQVQDTLVAAMVQQFRRPSFFDSVEESVPGLNELGKTVDWDKSLGFSMGEELVPLTQVTLNFRIDLREWDEYLEQTNRTKDSPFDPVLAELKRISSIIQGLKDDQNKEVEIPSTQKPGTLT